MPRGADHGVFRGLQPPSLGRFAPPPINAAAIHGFANHLRKHGHRVAWAIAACRGR